MAKTYQTNLYKARLETFELGWQINEGIILFESREYEDVSKAILELDFHEPSENNWFATMIERTDGIVTDQEIFDSSVIAFD